MNVLIVVNNLLTFETNLFQNSIALTHTQVIVIVGYCDLLRPTELLCVIVCYFELVRDIVNYCELL